MSTADRPAAPPASGPPEGRAGDRLDGWKAIAGYLGRDIRTVQRWEIGEGLPVRRLSHKQRASAYAFTGELDEWLAARVPDEIDAEAVGEGSEPGGVERATALGAPRRWRSAVPWLIALGVLGLIGYVALRSLDGTEAAHGDTRNLQAYAAFAEGQALYLSRRYREAAIALERAVTLDPSYGVAWAWLGKAYGRLAQPVWTGGPAAASRATEAATRAAHLAPDSSESHIALALAARARGDVEGWRAGARRAAELDARAAEALALLGDSYSAVIYSCSADQDPELAEEYYRQALELMPGLTTAVSNRAGNLRRLGRYAECVDLVNRSLRDYPDQAPLLAVRGLCRLQQGDVDGATEDIAPLRSHPRIAPAGSLVYLGLLALHTGRTEEGIRDLEAFTQFDHSARAELIAAEAYGLAGDLERGRAHIKRAIALDASCEAFVANSTAFAFANQQASLRH